jgi:hypothetical protein
MSAVAVTATSCGSSATAAEPSHAIGESFGGGTVFYIDGTGKHGFIAATADQSDGADWGCMSTSLAGAAGSAVGTGAQNTTDIVTGCSTAGIAARICDQLVLNGFSDWFLPSVAELNLLYGQRNVVGGFVTNAAYWTSTEVDGNTASYQVFSLAGTQGTQNKNWQTFGGTLLGHVRAIRAF